MSGSPSRRPCAALRAPLGSADAGTRSWPLSSRFGVEDVDRAAAELGGALAGEPRADRRDGRPRHAEQVGERLLGQREASSCRSGRGPGAASAPRAGRGCGGGCRRPSGRGARAARSRTGRRVRRSASLPRIAARNRSADIAWATPGTSTAASIAPVLADRRGDADDALGPTIVTPAVRPSAIVTDSATSAGFGEVHAPNRRVGMDERALGVQADALEVAPHALEVPRRERGQQVRVRGADAGDLRAMLPMPKDRRGRLQAGQPICSEVDRSATAVRLAFVTVTILQDSGRIRSRQSEATDDLPGAPLVRASRCTPESSRSLAARVARLQTTSRPASATPPGRPPRARRPSLARGLRDRPGAGLEPLPRLALHDLRRALGGLVGRGPAAAEPRRVPSRAARAAAALARRRRRKTSNRTIPPSIAERCHRPRCAHRTAEWRPYHRPVEHTAVTVLEVGAILLAAAVRRLGRPPPDAAGDRRLSRRRARRLAVHARATSPIGTQVSLFAEVGAILLLFEVGIEVDLRELRREHPARPVGRAAADGDHVRRRRSPRSLWLGLELAAAALLGARHRDVVERRRRQHHAQPAAHDATARPSTC